MIRHRLPIFCVGASLFFGTIVAWAVGFRAPWMWWALIASGLAFVGMQLRWTHQDLAAWEQDLAQGRHREL